MSSVAIVGNVNADIVVGPVTELPPPGGDLLVEVIEVRVGGAAANAALALTRLGLSPRLVGCVGDDLLGTFVHGRLRERGLADEIRVLPGISTGVSVCLEGPGRDRSFLSMRGALDAFDLTMVPEDVFESEFLLVCGYFTMNALRGEPMRLLLERSRAAGASILFDPDVDPGGWSLQAREEIERLLPLVDGFLPNEHEARGLTTMADPVMAARSLQRWSGGWVVVKLGVEGAVAVDPAGSVLRVTAPPVTVQDTTGAGDAFDAGLLFGLWQRWPWPDALSFAARLGSTVVARPGADRHPSLDEVLPG